MVVLSGIWRIVKLASLAIISTMAAASVKELAKDTWKWLTAGFAMLRGMFSPAV